MKILHDNQAAIGISKNPVHCYRIKHVEIDCYFIKENIENGIIKMVHTLTSLQTVDVLIEALP